MKLGADAWERITKGKRRKNENRGNAMKKQVHVIPWYGGKWRTAELPKDLILYIVWYVSWGLYYRLFKNKYEWR
jgi:hypothetical protein